jgi:hypothetical protein
VATVPAQGLHVRAHDRIRSLHRSEALLVASHRILQERRDDFAEHPRSHSIPAETDRTDESPSRQPEGPEPTSSTQFGDAVSYSEESPRNVDLDASGAIAGASLVWATDTGWVDRAPADGAAGGWVWMTAAGQLITTPSAGDAWLWVTPTGDVSTVPVGGPTGGG